MATFEQGDTVRVPFPYRDRSTRQHRPALVVSRGGIGQDGGLVWVAMITSAENRPWPDDVPLGRSGELTGLSAPSIVRPCKLATIDARHAQPLGAVPPALMAQVRASLLRYLGAGRSEVQPN
ncbi:MAG TPA: type II toxin-antitoxin system PemK/MazF family toxin [Caulobacteraceae bacterium]